MKYPNAKTLTKRLDSLPRETVLFAAHIDEYKNKWIGGANLGPQILTRLKKSSLITSAGASTRIEGSNLSDEQISKMIGGIKWETLQDRDTQEVKGYYELLEFVYNNYENIEISENIILQFHSVLLRYTNKDERHRGAYKTLENSVKMTNAGGKEIATLFETSPAFLTANHIGELIAWYNGIIDNPSVHKLMVISGFIIQFLKIHPFFDGNGRLSRILTDLLLLKHGYAYAPYVSLEKIIEDQKSEYYSALRGSQITFGTKKEDINKWTMFFLQACQAQGEEAVRLITGETLKDVLSENQRKVLEYFNGCDSANIKKLSAMLDIPRPTVKQVTTRLLGLRLITREGGGRATRYRRV